MFAMGKTCLLELRNLTKSFGGVRAVDHVSLRVDEGEIRAIIGPNGAGKSTLINLITKFLPVDDGVIRFLGKDITALPAHALPFLGIARTFQIPTVARELSVKENVQAALVSRHGRSLRLWQPAASMFDEPALELLELVGLREQAAVAAGSLSHADQKRLELAIALAAEPRLLIMDEPMAGVGAAERRELAALLLTMAARKGITLIFTEHDIDMVFALAGRITVMHAGRVLAEGEADEVRRNPSVQQVYLGAES